MLKEIVLPSGNVLEIGEVPFIQAKRLYQAIMDEFKTVDIQMTQVMDVNFIKNLVCTSIASSKIEKALAPCLMRSTYNGQKITDDTFEPLEARSDFMDVSAMVIQETILPFTKSLFAQFATISGALAKLQGSNSVKRQEQTAEMEPQPAMTE